ncbi:unnamed protein product [Soboliphyme baturini]|uniref:Histone acetyltransferase n=1 Tax=Soboliphyme baturini TaxID=241478 RepID=A0A183ICN4_9BILA|nr:unnamed protein product [Soboliphyme baturini]
MMRRKDAHPAVSTSEQQQGEKWFKMAQSSLALEMGNSRESQTFGSHIEKVRFGQFEIDTWYTSSYPDRFSILRTLFVCQYCFRYLKCETQLNRHLGKCTLSHPPGKEIYHADKLSFWEVDGEKNTAFCQNLCLFAKLFLEHKTLVDQVEAFNFYLMTGSEQEEYQMIGYFSKEKDPLSKYNVSCLLVLPPFHSKGYGRLLIDFSYMLTRIERKTSSPEHPLSDLGLIAYRKYWISKVMEYINGLSNDQMFSMADISQETGIHPNDIASTLQYIGIVKTWRGKYWIYKSEV